MVGFATQSGDSPHPGRAAATRAFPADVGLARARESGISAESATAGLSDMAVRTADARWSFRAAGWTATAQ
ncbi:MAG: hypothetical protein QOG37_1543 [Mycobacterium sp.]|jgi:hypothetical protein|nr:hypothetical protein [Mycobacterium sp.]